jgi:hypothetical protein
VALTPKQRAFVDNYLLVNNGSEACRLAGYKGDNVHVTASRLLRNVVIKDALELRRQGIEQGLKVTEENIITNLLDLAKNAKRESDRIRSWELLGKYKGIFKEQAQHIVGIFNQLKETESKQTETITPQEDKA